MRPVETLRIGSRRLPLAVNRYTGGLPDWPARAARAVTGIHVAGDAVNGLLGAGLLLGLGLGFRRQVGALAAGVAALWWAADWNFVYYRRVLGGTELALLTATLLIAWAVARLRDGDLQRAGAVGLLGAAIGLHAKITFAAPLAAALLASLALERRQALRALARQRRAWLLIALALLPAALAAAHHTALPLEPHIRSHDFPDLQWKRLLLGWQSLGDSRAAPARETLYNPLYFLAQPLAFFPHAYGTEPIQTWSSGRVLGWLLVLAGTLRAWWHARSPRVDLLRWLSLAVPLAAFALVALNRDIHHLAQLTGWLALWAGLAIAELVHALPISPTWRLWAALGALLPWGLANTTLLLRTDPLLATSPIHHARLDGQVALVQTLRTHRVQRVLTTDYDLYGAVDILAPELDIWHGWGALSHATDRTATLGNLLVAASQRPDGCHYLTVRPSAPTIYGTNPSASRLRRIAQTYPVRITEVAELTAPGEDKPWAHLWKIDPTAPGAAAPDPPPTARHPHPLPP